MHQWISYKDLPNDDIGLSKLFVHYVTDYNSVEPFYNGDFRDPAAWQSLFDIIASRPIERTKLVQILLNQNRNFQCGVRTLANIDLLLNDTTFAVVTGQQVGICGGPLYTLYKILTTLLLSEQLSQQFPNFNFVPVFWLESEDHDIDEATTLSLITKSSEFVTLKYELQKAQGQKNIGSVGALTFDDTIQKFLTDMESTVLPTEFSHSVFELLHNAYSPEMTFTRGFVHLYNVLLENSGIIFFDPRDRTAKQLMKPIFSKELLEQPKTCQLVISQSELLEHNYHAQVKPRAVNLFLNYNNGRYPIEPKDDGFFLRNTRQQYSSDELLSLLESNPELFSPNVVLRPICQDALFPTIAYVAGPSEIAYFAQFKPVYSHFGIPMPLIFPRASVTIMEERPKEILQKYNLSFIDIFKEKEFLKKQIVEQISDFKIEELFTNTAGTIEESLSSLKDGIEKIDPTLVPALSHTIERMLHSLSILKGKIYSAQDRQHETALRQLDRAITMLLPDSTLQERKINITYFLNKYGLEFVRWIQHEMEIDKFKHQIIYL
ncbi:MAG TPA: bacillithiol biosynthesis cysteine-adding enzyme BshC [Bacteroidota bacterium]|nr:bacillithiol biosynthesis cysteine-adding enzyme BshC [Bacteroidota bacterium]